MFGFGEWYPSYRCPPFILLAGVAAAVTDVGRSRGLCLDVFWHTDITATCSRDTTTIYLPAPRVYLSVVPAPSPSFTPTFSAALPTENKQEYVY